MSHAAARTLVRVVSALVPGDRRAEWLEEWDGELAALEDARAAGASGLPSSMGFAVGALPHALWMRTEGWTMDSMMQDLRYSVRVLLRAPGFTMVAALTLALGIGANAAIFTFVNGLVLRPPQGVQEADRLVQVARSYETDPRWDNFSWPAMRLIDAEARTLSGVAGYQTQAFVLGRGAETERVAGQLVTGSFFDVVGVSPHIGRLIQPSDDLEGGANHVVVLSHALWMRRYGGDPTVVGRTIQVGAEPFEVLGVAPAGFAGVEHIGTTPDVFIPATNAVGWDGTPPFARWGSSWINVIGRLAEGVSFEEAEASMGVVSQRLRDADPVNEGMLVLLAQGVGLDPEGREEAMQVSLILLLIVGLVLLLTCTNVANLSLSRATTRQTEVGVRMALGAGRGRLVRQLVTESSLLAVAGILLAVPIVLMAGDFLPLVFPITVATSLEADGRVFAFLLAVGVLAGFLFGVAPAWSASRGAVTGSLREGASTGPRSKTRLRDALVVAQLGLSLGLVAGAALLGRSVLNARMAQPGFEPAGLVAAFVDLAATGRYDRETGNELYDRLVAQASSLPGVRSATVANQTPIAGGHSRATVQPAGRDDVSFEAEYVIVGPRYFETMGIPLLQGRTLGGLADEPERVVVVNEALASMFWPGESALGKEIAGRPNWRVVGVAGDVQMRSLRSAPNPAVYYPMAQLYDPFMVLHLSAESARALSPEQIRRTVAEADPELPVSAIVRLDAAMTDSMGETRTIGYLVAAFAALALALAAVGLYGLVSYAASQRVREIGIRIALGADPDSLVRLVLAKGVGISVLGVGLGLLISYGLGSAMQSLLFGVTYTDVTTLGAAAVVLVVAAGTAAWLPARRASRVDAAVSLRD